MNSGEKPRPPLPEGPFLVVGSGALRRGHRERARRAWRGRASGSTPARLRRRQGLTRQASKSVWAWKEHGNSIVPERW